jgi:hypothetical protein
LKTLRTFVITIFTLHLVACNLPLSPPSTNISTPVAPTSQAPEIAIIPTIAITPTTAIIPTTTKIPAEHQIGIRIVNGVGEFYDRTTGNLFVPRGMNYIRLAHQLKLDGSSTFGHSLFDPGKYNSSRVSSDLQKMHSDGYNLIRVFLSPDTMGSTSNGLSPAYMKNIVDLLIYAKQNQIHVMFTLDWIPGGKYGEILNADCCSTFALMNANFLPPAGLKANQTFYQDFISELLKLKAPTEQIFSYQLRNEMFFDSDQPPLSFNSGVIKTANGKSYDMSKPSDKELMLNENAVYWIDEMRASILEIDPTALVSVGFFHPQKPNPSRIGDPRLVVTEPVIWNSTVDFVDLHTYPGFELNLKQHVENYGISNMKEKPIIMGEFGGEISRFSSIQAAANAFIDWQVESCKYGFDGWIFWTWDLTEQPDFFNALMYEGAINGVIAPLTRPDPCSP